MFGIDDKLVIRTDFRIELLSLVIFLSDLNEKHFIVKRENEYTAMLNTEFKSFKRHQVVSKFPDIWDKGLRWDGIPQLALHLNDNIELLNQIKYSHDLQSRFKNNINELVEFVDLLRDFANKTNFESYYKKEYKNVERYLSILNQELERYPVIPILEKYINLKLNKTTVILSNLLKSAYGITIGSKNYKEICCILSRHWLNVAIQNNCLDRILLSTIWHEFLHSIINPLTDKLFKNPYDLSETQLDWYCKLNESIIWAITLRLLIQEKIVCATNNEWYFKNAIRNGAPKTKEMNDLLVEYEKNKLKFKSIDNYYPILQKEFGQIPK